MGEECSGTWKIKFQARFMNGDEADAEHHANYSELLYELKQYHLKVAQIKAADEKKKAEDENERKVLKFQEKLMSTGGDRKDDGRVYSKSKKQYVGGEKRGVGRPKGSSGKGLNKPGEMHNPATEDKKKKKKEKERKKAINERTFMLNWMSRSSSGREEVTICDLGDSDDEDEMGSAIMSIRDKLAIADESVIYKGSGKAMDFTAKGLDNAITKLEAAVRNTNISKTLGGGRRSALGRVLKRVRLLSYFKHIREGEHNRIEVSKKVLTATTGKQTKSKKGSAALRKSAEHFYKHGAIEDSRQGLHTKV